MMHPQADGPRERRRLAITAGLTSLRLVLSPWFAGLVVVAPIVGHASWHACGAAVV